MRFHLFSSESPAKNDRNYNNQIPLREVKFAHVIIRALLNSRTQI